MTLQEENEKLREALDHIGGLSQQAEPSCSDERPCVSCFSDDGACLAQPAPAQDELLPVATVKYGGYTSGNQLLWERGAGLQFLQEGTALYAGEIPQLRAVAYLDIGAGGYIDFGSDLTNKQLEALPWGRHMLGIIGTYGADGYVPAARPAQTEQQPSATQQILDLIMEQCQYWHGRDEARRGGFACLYAEAKAVADNAAPQPEQSDLRAIHAMILNALDRDAEEGKAVRGEMAAELRAALSAQEK